MILPKSRSFRLNSRRRLEAENAMLRYQLIVLQRQLRSILLLLAYATY
jgi:hypothetical protein